MSLMHPGLLLGLGLAVIPILLHLLLKAKPKRLIFPALRLIQQNRRQNVRRLQLRHLWLLLLRVLVIALIALALTRPSLPAANYSLVWSEWTSLTVVLGLGIGCYFAVLSWWKRQQTSRNQLLNRRTMLRGGVGGATALLLLLAVGWPYSRRVAAEIKAPAPKVADNIPAAAVFLFDTSPSMSYRKGNQTRLQYSQQIARDHLSRLPSGSKVAVTGLQDEASPVFSLDLQSAKSKIDAFDIKSTGLSLNDRLRSVLLSQEDDRRRVTSEQSVPEDKRQDRYIREIYVFTDLTRSAWREESSSLLREELQRLNFVSVYFIDVGETDPSNVGISSIRLSREAIPAGGTLKLDAVMSSTGNVKAEQTVEVFMSGPDGKLTKKGQKSVTLDSSAERQLTFEVPNIIAPFQQGEIRIVGSDPLPFDDVGYFTVQTLPPIKVAVAAETPQIARNWQSILDYMSKEKITDFLPQFVTVRQLRTADLTQFDVICMINASAPDEVIWTKLHAFVASGGGLGVFLGASNAASSATRKIDQIDPVFYNSKAAQTVLPAKLNAALTFVPAQTLDVRNSQHALLRRLDDLSALTELGAIDITRYWKIEPQESSILIAKYDDKRAAPALIERRIDLGRVIMMTTSVDNVEWNDFLINNAWFWVFADQMTQYLSQQSSLKCNYEVGNEVTLPLTRNRKLRKVVVRIPDFKQRTQEVAADSSSLLLRELTTAGSYLVDSSDNDSEFHTGFSMTNSSRESDLKRMEIQDLNSLLGEGRFSVNRDPGSLERNVQTGRLGQEAYSIAVALLVAVFAAEQFTATWFYRTDEV